jgi:hypothetical protein
LKEFVERHCQNVGVNDLERVTKGLAQDRDGPSVDFDCDKPRASLNHVPGERALPRSDFNDDVVSAKVQGIDNVANNIFVAEKILSEGFFWRKHTRRPGQYTEPMRYFQ